MKIKKWKSRVAMALCVAMTGILVGCGATGEEESSVDMSEAGGKNTIVVLNYGEYIDTSVLKQFQKETVPDHFHLWMHDNRSLLQ